MLAAARGRYEICELLIGEGAEVWATNPKGLNALSLADAGRHPRLAALLASQAQTCAAPDEDAPQQGEAELPAPLGILLTDLVDSGEVICAGTWEPEAEIVRPRNDETVLAAVTAVQLTAASHRAVDHDVDWSDVAIDLPAAVAHRSDNPILQDEFIRLRRLLGAGLIEGAVSAQALEAVFAPAAIEDPEGARIRLDAAWTVLPDLGISFDEEGGWLAEPTTAESPEDVTEDVYALIESIGDSADVLRPFYSDLARQPRLAADEEQRLWQTLGEEAVRLGAVVAATPALLFPLMFELQRQATAAAERIDQPVGSAGNEDVPTPGHAESSATAARNQLIGLAGKLVEGSSTERQIDDPSRQMLMRLLGRMQPSTETLEALCRAIIAAQPAECEVVRDILARVARLKSRVVTRHLKLVIWWAGKYSRRQLAQADLIQEGSIGLMRATDRFEWGRGHKFSTYAVWWIRQSITRALAESEHLIRRPVHVTELLNRVLRARTNMIYRLSREPTAEELAEEVGEAPRRVQRVLALVPDVRPLEEPAGNSTEEGDVSGPSEQAIAAVTGAEAFEVVARAQLRSLATQALASLSAREERILRLRFGFDPGDDHTLEECGEMFGVTRERIRQIEAKALKRLERPAGARRLLRTFVVS